MLDRSASSALLALLLSTSALACGGADTSGNPTAEGTASGEQAVGVDSTIATTYACTTALGNATFHVKVSGHTPASITTSQHVVMVNFQETVTIPATLVNQAIADGATSASGEAITMDVNSTDAVQETINAAKTPLAFGPVPLVKGQPVVATFPVAPERLASWAPKAAGTMTFSPGNVVMNITLSPLGTSQITCTPKSTFTLSTTTVN